MNEPDLLCELNLERCLLVENFFDVSDFFLGLAFNLIGTAFGLESWIVDDFTGRLLDLAGHIFGGAFNFILSA